MRRGENIYKRSDGRWEGRYIASRDVSGKAHYRSIYAYTYLEVREKLRLAPKENIKSNKTLFPNIAEKWLCSVKLRCKTSTYNKYYSQYTNHLLPAFEKINIADISNVRIEELFAEKANISEKTKADILSIIRQILKYAQGIGMIIDPTTQDISIRQQRKDIRVLTSSEQKRLEECLLQKTDLTRIGAYIVLYTGLRIGELCALKRESIDFQKRIIHVGATMQRMRVEGANSKTEVIITESKSKCSIRDIPISTTLMKLFKKYYSNFKPGDFLLTGSDKYIEPRLLNYRFHQYIADCELKDVHFHTLRHTFATRCIERGVDVKSLSEILGHYDVNITLNRYVHPSLELKRSGMEKLHY